MIVAKLGDISRGGDLMPGSQDDDALPLCGSDDLAVVVNWEHGGPALEGQVVAENVSGRACRLADKPEVTPLQPDGAPLPVKTIISLEMKVPRYVILQPGQRAAARVHWGSWCGQQATDQAQVRWTGGSTVATVHGPTQPECSPGRPDNMTSSWFRLMT
jgi:hypothetical protein